MTRLEDLKTSLLDMTYDERMEKLREIREDRKVSKYAVTVRAKRVKDKSTKIEKQFSDMSPEDQKLFLEMLQDEDTAG